MNAYDFDKTIFYPDSSATFYKYCIGKHPFTVAKSVPAAAVYAVKYFRGKASAAELKEKLFAFLPEIEDIDAELESFWDENISGIGDWYLRQRREDDLIISASPEFIIEPVSKRLGFRLIGTRMDRHTGKIEGLNNHGKEKVRRFREEYGTETIEEFYSDSLSDTPMAELAERAYLVDKHRLSPWTEND